MSNDLSALFQLIWWLSWGLSLVTVPNVLVLRAARPQSAMSWMLFLFFVPPLALPAWWLFGHTHLKIKRKIRQRSQLDFRWTLQEISRTSSILPQEASRALLDIVSLPVDLQIGVFPPSSANRAILFDSISDAYDEWEKCMRRAKHHIHLLFYAWRDDTNGRRFRDVLSEKAKEGVRVRLLLDWVGTSASSEFFEPVTRAGGQVVWFMPPKLFRRSYINFRNHRKMIVIDGQTGFIGGINVGNEYLQWFDLALKLQGPVVNQIQEVFCDDWYFSNEEEQLCEIDYFGLWPDIDLLKEPRQDEIYNVSCATVAGGPHQQINATQEMLFLALTSAKKRIWIMTPYFIPEQAIILALRAARYRGVDVRLFLPGKSDSLIVRRASRAYYSELLQADIRIYEYSRMLHAKALLVDDHLVILGSANVDIRSFRLNFEMSIFCESQSLNARLSSVFETTKLQSYRVLPNDYTNMPWFTRVVDSAMHLMSPLL